jgi:hypothetical protein
MIAPKPHYFGRAEEHFLPTFSPIMPPREKRKVAKSEDYVSDDEDLGSESEGELDVGYEEDSDFDASPKPKKKTPSKKPAATKKPAAAKKPAAPRARKKADLEGKCNASNEGPSPY